MAPRLKWPPLRSLVRVEWLDARAAPPWMALDDVELLELARIRTAGFLVRRDRDVIVIAGQCAEDDDVSNVAIIPAKCVVSVRARKTR